MFVDWTASGYRPACSRTGHINADMLISACFDLEEPSLHPPPSPSIPPPPPPSPSCSSPGQTVIFPLDWNVGSSSSSSLQRSGNCYRLLRLSEVCRGQMGTSGPDQKRAASRARLQMERRERWLDGGKERVKLFCALGNLRKIKYISCSETQLLEKHYLLEQITCVDGVELEHPARGWFNLTWETRLGFSTRVQCAHNSTDDWQPWSKGIVSWRARIREGFTRVDAVSPRRLTLTVGPSCP